eukprot:9814771-Alexandrium_andersonii.AAC.1
MSANMLLTYGRASPSQALLGFQPRELYDFDNRSISAAAAATEPAPDAAEVATRLRLAAKEAILQAAVEDRLARARAAK